MDSHETVYSQRNVFAFRLSVFFLIFGPVRQIKLAYVSLGPHVNIVYRIVGRADYRVECGPPALMYGYSIRLCRPTT